MNVLCIVVYFPYQWFVIVSCLSFLARSPSRKDLKFLPGREQAARCTGLPSRSRTGRWSRTLTATKENINMYLHVYYTGKELTLTCFGCLLFAFFANSITEPITRSESFYIILIFSLLSNLVLQGNVSRKKWKTEIKRTLALNWNRIALQYLVPFI